MAKTVGDFLADLGHRVDLHSSIEGLAREIRGYEGSNGVVIAEVMSEDRQGLDLLKELHAARPAIEVIAMTPSEGTSVSSGEAVEFGVYGFLRKPVRLAELELMVLRIQERKRRHSLGTTEEGIGLQIAP